MGPFIFFTVLLGFANKKAQLMQGLHSTAPLVAILDIIKPEIAPFDLLTLKTLA